ncbi:MAG TPA: tetratricopeptide repeat protein [Polyangia bacterium]|nr:tetratricopeptide repeat protein [Polyangia bacterium]
MAKRYTRKDLKRPDEFVSFWQHAYEFLKQNGRPIVIGTVVALVAIIGTTAFSDHSARIEGEASLALSRAMRMYETDLAADDEAAKKAQNEDGIPRFKTADERRQATLSELDAMLAKYRSTGAAREAMLVRAGVQLDGQQFDQAIKGYGDFLAESDSEQRLRFLAREGRGYAFEGKGQLDLALDEFRKLEMEGELYRDRALYHQARILERKGDPQGAEKMYKMVLEKYPTTSLRDDISNRLAALEAR